MVSVGNNAIDAKSDPLRVMLGGSIVGVQSEVSLSSSESTSMWMDAWVNADAEAEERANDTKLAVKVRREP